MYKAFFRHTRWLLLKGALRFHDVGLLLTNPIRRFENMEISIEWKAGSSAVLFLLYSFVTFTGSHLCIGKCRSMTINPLVITPLLKRSNH